ncbi:hypothetical protein N7486_007425 [Penicillium sp. IBT 16267x]|nr:hypothetical protein N7486_007425 [Penicillium sp. IBT 16267x]
MRPALTRLLKRPSALSIIDSLAASSIGIEQLESRYARLRCHSQCTNQSSLVDDNNPGPSHQKTKTLWPTESKKKPVSFSVYDIEPNPQSEEPSFCANDVAPGDASEYLVKSLRLNPERLEFESDIGHTNDLGSRLVDLPEHRNNFELWEELLRFRQRHYGDQGTQAIWEGLTNRAGGVKLPLTGNRADFFWQSFVDLGLTREIFLKDVLDYAIILGGSDGCCWPRLYEQVVGGLLDRGMSKRAIEWHRKLQDSHLANPSDLIRIMPYAISPQSLPPVNDLLLFANPRPQLGSKKPYMRLKTLKALCRGIDHQIYGPVILKSLEQGYGEDALAMHGWLTTRNDHPQSLQELQPLLEYTRKYGLRQEYDNLRDYAQNRFPSLSLEQDLSQKPPANETNQRDQGNTKSSRSGKHQYKDDIAARLFATRALNLDMVIGGLRMLGISKIGPRTLREMAVRARDSREILGNLKLLRQSGITTPDSVFARLVPKLAAQNREFLLSDLLQSDQHPDVLEDVKLQESLLVSYYMARDWRQYNVSLAILGEHFSDSPGLLDIHFRKHMATGELGAASKVVDELTLLGKTLSEDSVDFMAEKLLPRRRMHHKPQVRPAPVAGEALMFVFKVLQRVVPTGCYVSPDFWEELLKRLGMGNHWNELRECSLWLVRQYSHRPEGSGKLRGIFPSQQRSINRSDSRVLDLIFSERMQQAIIAWGFRFRVTRDTETKYSCEHPATGDKLIPWIRGLILLRELEEAGLTLQLGPIRAATKIRLNILFGLYCHSAVRFNRMLRRVNPYSQDRVFKDINLAWGESLFQGMEYSQPERLLNPTRTYFSRRNSRGVTLSRRRAR